MAATDPGADLALTPQQVVEHEARRRPRTGLLALAASALAKKRIVAQGLLVGAVMGGAWIGNALQIVLHWPWGNVVNLSEVMRSLLEALYGVPLQSPLPIAAAAIAVPGMAAACLLILATRLKAKEVVR